MKFLLSLSLLSLTSMAANAAAAAASAAKAPPLPHALPSLAQLSEKVDTNRAPRFFDPPQARKAGYTYADEFSLQATAQVELPGLNSLKLRLDGVGDTRMVVQERQGGRPGMELQVWVEHLTGNVESVIMNEHCDSNDREHSTKNCDDLFAVVGQHETIELNSAGEVLTIQDFTGHLIYMDALGQPDPATTIVAPQDANSNDLQSKFRANQFAASQHFQKTTQILELIPDHAVRPGDSWMDDVSMDGLGVFKGTSYFKGYTDCPHHDRECALFEFEGGLHLMDTTALEELFGAATVLDKKLMPQESKDVSVARITTVIFWDFEDEISRWAQANVTVAFDAPLINGDPNTMVHVPVDFTVAWATDIVERPDGETAPKRTKATGIGSMDASQPGRGTTTSSDTTSHGGIVFALMVGIAAAAGFMVYKKKNEPQYANSTGLMRQMYDFMPIPNNQSEPMIHPHDGFNNNNLNHQVV